MSICLLKSCHSLTLGIENFASIISGRFWPGRAKEDVKLLAEKLSFAELRDGKFRQHPQWLVLAVTNLPIIQLTRQKHHKRRYGELHDSV